MIYLDIGDEPLETLRKAARLISTGEAGFHAMTAGEVKPSPRHRRRRTRWSSSP